MGSDQLEHLAEYKVIRRTLYMDDIKKKKFVAPEVEVIDFADDDIITLSETTGLLNWWEGDGDNNEDF